MEVDNESEKIGHDRAEKQSRYAAKGPEGGQSFVETYQDFLHSKIEVAPISGFTVSPSVLSPALKPHQSARIRTRKKSVFSLSAS